MRTAGSILALLIGLSGVSACGGTDPSASGVFPDSGFLGRQVRVQVSGDATEWDNGTTVSFGDGITVDSVAVASPTAVFAEITIADTATPGPRDVVVTGGGETVTLRQAFELESPISVTFQGSLAQGSVLVANIINHDFNTPFDTTATGGLFTPLEFTNLDVTTGPGVTMVIDDATPYSMSATVFVDVDATTGSLAINSGPSTGTITSFPLGESVEIAPRTATALTAGMNATGMVTMPFESSLYEFTPATFPSLARFQTSTTGDGDPIVAVLAESGHFDELLGSGADSRQVAKTSTKFYVVVVDLTGELGAFNVRAGSAPLSLVADTEPGNNTRVGATAITLPALVENATLATAADEDWFSFSVAAGDVGKKVRVRTLPGDDFTDTIVDVLSGVTSLGGPSGDSGYHENFLSSAIAAAGALTVQIAGSPEWSDDTQTGYDALIYLE